MLTQKIAALAGGLNSATQVPPVSLEPVLHNIHEGHGKIYEQINNLSASAMFMAVGIVINYLGTPCFTTAAVVTGATTLGMGLFFKHTPLLLQMAKAQEKCTCNIMMKAEDDLRKLPPQIRREFTLSTEEVDSTPIGPVLINIKEGYGKIYEEIKNFTVGAVITAFGMVISYLGVPSITTSAVATGTIVLGIGLHFNTTSSLLKMAKVQEKYACDVIIVVEREIRKYQIQ